MTITIGKSTSSNVLMALSAVALAKAEKYYVGKTNDLDDRLQRHQKGQVSFTSSRLPFELVTYISFDNEWKASLMEKYLKSGSGRAFAKRHFY